VPLTIQGAASQTADLLDVKDSGGARRLYLDNGGTLWVMGGGAGGAIYGPSGSQLYMGINGTAYMYFNGANAITFFTNAARFNGNVGFFNTAPVAKPTVSGAKASNAALGSLLAALAALGLITDSTTA
jgi:hypothetical protein